MYSAVIDLPLETVVPVFVINLDRRRDRLDFMAEQLGELGVAWERVSAYDALSVDQNTLRNGVALDGHRVEMGPGSRCCALSNLDIFRRIANDKHPAALILQDDVRLSPDIVPFLRSLEWLPAGVDLIQFEKYGSKYSKKLVGPSIGVLPVEGRTLHRLHSRAGGAACYLITRRGAQRILDETPVLDMPIDHFLFSPNLSPVFYELGVSIVRPALARQDNRLGSELNAERKSRRKGPAVRLRRLWQDLNRVPRQVRAMINGAKWLDFHFTK